MIPVSEGKTALDKIIKKTRVHLYKPIQIAEILFKQRSGEIDDLADLESYRSASKHWRDAITVPFIGAKCSSSAKFQDDVFSETAMPPRLLVGLGEINKRSGAVEAYIYQAFKDKYFQLNEALNYCLEATPLTFDLKVFLGMFWAEAGLKRSLDKIFEIVVYALFEVIVTNSGLKIALRIDGDGSVLKEFHEFAQKVLGLHSDLAFEEVDAHFHRVGITNAADRGLDMYANFGSVVQIKHLDLNETLAGDIVSSVASDRIVIVCKQVDAELVTKVLNQLGFSHRIQAIVSVEELIEWYSRALTGVNSCMLADRLIETLGEQIQLEFPSLGGDDFDDFCRGRGYKLG